MFSECISYVCVRSNAVHHGNSKQVGNAAYASRPYGVCNLKQQAEYPDSVFYNFQPNVPAAQGSEAAAATAASASAEADAVS